MCTQALLHVKETNGIAEPQGRSRSIVVSMLPLSCHYEEKPRVRRDAIKKLNFKIDLKG